MMIIRKLNEVCYTCQNILNKIISDNYIACILCLVEASYTSDHSALLVVYSDLEAEMRCDVKMSTVSITKKKFIQQMKNQQYNWKNIFSHYQFFQKTEIKFRARQLTNLKSFYISHFYYQSLMHISYFQSYSVLTYSSQDEWFLQEYNSY